MAGNLPDHVRPGDPDAPWNDDCEEPDRWCPHCREPYFDLDRREIELGPFGLTVIYHRLCPACAEVVSASRSDVTRSFLLSWREYPEEMECEIERYTDLRAVPEVSA